MNTIEMLEELKNFDTPSITNVVATYPESPLCLGLYNPWSENWYTDQTIRCMYPELGLSPLWSLPSVALLVAHWTPDLCVSRAVQPARTGFWTIPGVPRLRR